MPKRYFRYRNEKSIVKHIVALWQYLDLCQRRPDSPFECAVQWIVHPKFGYNELIIASHDSSRLLERICCALATHELNILSADIYTRPDGITLDLFRVCDDELKAITTCCHMRLLETAIVGGIGLVSVQAIDLDSFL
jgi:[protein-PII] uridylyltransferase